MREPGAGARQSLEAPSVHRGELVAPLALEQTGAEEGQSEHGDSRRGGCGHDQARGQGWFPCPGIEEDLEGVATATVPPCAARPGAALGGEPAEEELQLAGRQPRRALAHGNDLVASGVIQAQAAHLCASLLEQGSEQGRPLGHTHLAQLPFGPVREAEHAAVPGQVVVGRHGPGGEPGQGDHDDRRDRRSRGQQHGPAEHGVGIPHGATLLQDEATGTEPGRQ